MFDKMVKSGYFMYVAEASGLDNLVSTKTAKINASIRDFIYIKNRGGNPNDCINEVLAKHGLTQDMLTEAECEKIMRAVMRAW